MTIIDPHTYQPIRPVTEETKVAAPEPANEADYAPVLQRYKVPAGRLLVVRDKVPETWDKDGLIAATEDRKQLMQQFEPWATVLMIGPPYKTDYGTTIEPPAVEVGQRVLISPTGGSDVELSAGGVTMTVTLVGFGGVMLIDGGEAE